MKPMNIVGRFGPSIAVASAALVPLFSHAAVIDVAAALTGITDAQTAVLSVIGAMLTMSIAVWGLRRVIRLFGR